MATYNDWKTSKIRGLFQNSDYPDGSQLADAIFDRNITIFGNTNAKGDLWLGNVIITYDASGNPISAVESGGTIHFFYQGIQYNIRLQDLLQLDSEKFGLVALRSWTLEQINLTVNNLLAGAPGSLDTLYELANALGNDPNFAATIASLIGTKAGLSSNNTFSGTNTFNNSITFSSTLNGVNVTTFGYISGLTSSAQTQLNTISSSLSNYLLSSTASSTYASLTANNTFSGTNTFNNSITFSTTLNGINATTFGYISGLTSSAQIQLTSLSTSKANLSNPTFSSYIYFGNANGSYPSLNNFLAIGSNLSAGHAEGNFINVATSIQTSSLMAFNFSKLLSSSTKSDLLKIFNNGNATLLGILTASDVKTTGANPITSLNTTINTINTTIASLPTTYQAILLFDTVPTSGSSKMLSSGSIFNALQNYLLSSTASSTYQPLLQFDTIPTMNSNKMLTSGSIYTALSSYQPSLSYDSSPTANSINLVNSGDLYNYFQNYALESALSSYLLSSTAAATYQTQAGMSSYLTTANAASIYQTQAGMSSYLLSSTAAATYQTQDGMSSYLTTANAASTYQTQAGMSSYLLSSTAATTYASLSNNNTFSGVQTVNNNIFSRNLLLQGDGTNAYIRPINGSSILYLGNSNNNTASLDINGFHFNNQSGTEVAYIDNSGNLNSTQMTNLTNQVSGLVLAPSSAGWHQIATITNFTNTNLPSFIITFVNQRSELKIFGQIWASGSTSLFNATYQENAMQSALVVNNSTTLGYVKVSDTQYNLFINVGTNIVGNLFFQASRCNVTLLNIYIGTTAPAGINYSVSPVMYRDEYATNLYLTGNMTTNKINLLNSNVMPTTNQLGNRIITTLENTSSPFYFTLNSIINYNVTIADTGVYQVLWQVNNAYWGNPSGTGFNLILSCSSDSMIYRNGMCLNGAVTLHLQVSGVFNITTANSTINLLSDANVVRIGGYNCIVTRIA